MISLRTIIAGVPLCCWPGCLARLAAGIAWGWLTVRTRGYPGARWYVWKSWYWPGFVHPHRFSESCRHGSMPPCPRCRRPLDATACGEYHAALHFAEEAARSEAA